MKSEIEAPSGTEPHTNGCVQAPTGEEQRAKAPPETLLLPSATEDARVRALFRPTAARRVV